jgi:transcriptional regulator with XRE-family HTH domain
MTLSDKIHMLMARNRVNGQKLARQSQVSDSEISRILQGKSRPGLDNAFKLAKALGVSLDFLADDTLDVDPNQAAESRLPDEQKLLTAAHKIGYREVLTLLEVIRSLGYDLALNRLVGGKPILEIDTGSLESRPAAQVPAQATPVAPPRAASATA